MSSIPYVVLLLSGFIALHCNDNGEGTLCNPVFIYGIYIAAAFFTGLGKSVLWVLGIGYVAEAATEGKEGKYHGLFWTIFQCSQLLGNTVSFLLIHFFGTTVYFATMTI